MPDFEYEALTLDGKTTRGRVDARDRQDALRRLDQMDLQPIRITGKDTASRPVSDFNAPHLSSKQIILFTEDLCDLLEAGLQLDPAMSILEKRQSSEPLRITALRIRKHLREGYSFAKALHHASPSFSQLYCSMAEAGEAGGALAKIMRQHVIFLTALSNLRSKAIQALIYPAFIMGAGFLVLVLFVTQLAPQLDQLFSQTGTPPPVLTQMLMDVSGFFLNFWWAVLALLVVLGAGFRLFVTTPQGKAWWGKTRQHLPGFGPVLQTHFLAQFSKTLASLLQNGIPLLNSLKLVRNGINNPYYGKALDQAIVSVGDGAPLSMALRQTKAFPALFLDLLTVGEQTGRLGPSLDKASDRFEKEMDVQIRRLIALIGPIVIIVLAFVVAVVTYSVVTSIFEAVQGVRSKF